MAEKILMTALSPTMEEGVISKWLKKEGDKIQEGDVVCEVETDKATVDYEATFEGTLLKITLPEGSGAKVGDLIGIVGKPGEDFSALLSGITVEEKYDYDVVVIGSGPGGYVSAIRASQLGLKAAIIEKDKEGGVCLNWGCIPTKALIHQAEIYNYIQEAPYMGLHIDDNKLDYAKIQQKSRDAANTLNKGVIGLLKKNKVDVFKGFGSITDKNHVHVKGEKDIDLSTKNILIATGSRPRQIPGFEFDEKLVLSSTGFLDMKSLPKSMIILGAGVIGMEIGFILSSFKVEVTIVEMLPNALAIEDQDAVKLVEAKFKEHNVKILKSTKALSMRKKENSIELDIEDKDGKISTLNADKILVSIGRAANTEGLGLEKLGIQLEKGYIKINDNYKTTVPNIYAIGDIVFGTPQLAHVASKEGEIAIEHMAGKGHETFINLNEIPAAIYTTPELASFGPNERVLKEKEIEYNKFVFPYVGIGKTVAVEKSQGFVKILVDKKTKEILSAVIVGYSATELIHEILLAKKSEVLPEDIATMIHAHPTISEGIMEAARGLEGWAIHI